MMDALCQGIESWWSVNSTEESYEYSRKTVELIMANWRKYIFENDDEAAAQIMLAANYGYDESLVNGSNRRKKSRSSNRRKSSGQKKLKKLSNSLKI